MARKRSVQPIREEPMPEVLLVPDEIHPNYIFDETGRCQPISGRYVCSDATIPAAAGSLRVTVRVDVDRYYPQHCISIELQQTNSPKRRNHAIAKVEQNTCTGQNRRRIRARVDYIDPEANTAFAFNMGDVVEFRASPIGRQSQDYDQFTLTLKRGRTTLLNCELNFESKYFDPLEVEIAHIVTGQEDPIGPIITYNIASNNLRPAEKHLPVEVISLATVFQRAGFCVKMSSGIKVFPLTSVKNNRNTPWTKSDLHDAMVRCWGEHSPQWAMWLVFVHGESDRGKKLLGGMFEEFYNKGINTRQGAAIFTKGEFAKLAPFDSRDPSKFNGSVQAINRAVFFNAVHEMGHAFHLFHSREKAELPKLKFSPWVRLVNVLDSLSFMNEPAEFEGGPDEFFRAFCFRFSDEELYFMRHAPRRFVQMGNDRVNKNHALEIRAPTIVLHR